MPSSQPPVVLITGANQGLGYGIAETLFQSRKAYTILVGSRDIARGEAAVSQLQSSEHNEDSTISAIQIDLNSSISINIALEQIEDKYGRIDVLVNNAGIFGAPGKLWASTTRPDWRAIFEVNVFGTIELTELAFALLQKSPSPRIVVVSSNMGSINMVANGHVPCGTVGAYYSASKAAINAMVANWSQLQKDIKFWAVCPGLVASNFGGEFTKQNGRDAKEAAEIVKRCVEGENDGGLGRFSWEKDGNLGIYEW